jgi:gliding motility-associated-like protein
MKIQRFLGLFLAVFLTLSVSAADNSPKVSPTATYIDKDGELQEVTKIEDGEAPLEVTFKANPENMGELLPSYVWRFRREGDESDLLVRYEEETVYRFVESGTFDVSLVAYNGEELIDSATVTVIISESKLEFPNSFSPNNDGTNDVYGAKGVNDPNHTAHWKSIVDFHAYIFNRWGQKLYEWHDVSGSWDGTFKGHPVKDGVYFLLVKAKGADGKNYNIRKDINLLRGYIQGDNNSGGETTTP